MVEIETEFEYVICPKCGQVNPAIMLYRAFLEVRCYKEIKDREKRKIFLKRLRSLSWEQFAEFLGKI